jgi:hypothetical protein
MSHSFIKFLNREEIDDERWNDAIANAVNTNIYGFSWYLDAVSPGWCALIEGDYTAVMPLTWRTKYFINYVFTPAYCQQLGVFSTKPTDEHQILRFLEAIPKKFRYIDLNLNVANSLSNPAISVASKRNLVLTLGHDIDLIRQSYSTNHKRNIKKAIDAGITVHADGDMETIIRFFEKGRGGRLSHNPDREHSIFKQLCKSVASYARVSIWMAHDAQNSPCGGAVFFETKQGAYFIFSGVSDEGRKHSVMHLLVDRFIHHAVGRLQFLDFEGSNDPDLARFYSGFGAAECLYLHITINRLPTIIRWVKNS